MPNMKLGRLSKLKSLCERRLISVCLYECVSVCICIIVSNAVRAYKLGGTLHDSRDNPGESRMDSVSSVKMGEKWHECQQTFQTELKREVVELTGSEC